MIRVQVLILLFFAVSILRQHGFCQGTDLALIRSAADSAYGLNDLLVNGRIYVNANPRANGHPFYPEETSSKGTIYVKGEKFDAVKINYCAELDELVLDVGETMPWIEYIVLNNKLVDSFLIGNRTFVNVNALPVKVAGMVYLEKIFEGKFSLFAKRRKIFKPEFNHWNPRGVYLEEKPLYLIMDNDGSHDITRKKQLLNYFSGHKKELKKYLYRNNINLQKADIRQLKNVAVFCNGLF